MLMLYGLSVLQLFQHPVNVLGFEYAVSLEQVEDCVIHVEQAHLHDPTFKPFIMCVCPTHTRIN